MRHELACLISLYESGAIDPVALYLESEADLPDTGDAVLDGATQTQ